MECIASNYVEGEGYATWTCSATTTDINALPIVLGFGITSFILTALFFVILLKK